MTTIEILSILLIHWIADFVCQTDKMATGKSKNWTDLLHHTGVYSAIWFIPILGMFVFYGTLENIPLLVQKCIAFCLITLICHTATDYFTSRLNSKLWADKKVHYFFVSIGFDQWLHYVQLFLTYQYLKPL